jgi:hypothetical protein
MPYTVQVTIDSHDPHALADWWADVLGWQVEAQDENFIRQMIAAGHATVEDTIVHNGALVWRPGAAITSPDGNAPRILFQHVPEAKVVKNRVHLDLRIGDDDPEAARARVQERGATVVGGGHEGPRAWVTFADPEGNEFCL